MKKTLITLLALAGAAVATEGDQHPITFTATFNKDITASSSLDAFFQFDNLTLYKTVDASTLNSATNGDFMTDRLRPNSNVDSAATNSWTLEFTLYNKVDADLTINSITLSAFSFNGGGTVQTNNRNFLFTITAGETEIATDENLYITGSNMNGNTLPLNLTDAITIAAQGSLDLKIMVEQGEFVNNGNDAYGNPIGRGSYVGLNTVTFSGTVPEPTTATLSLLALAGLAARRRRK